MREKLVLLYELEKRNDGTYGIGNSIEVSESEAVLLIQSKQAKSPFAPIGEVPSFLVVEEVEEVKDVDNII